MAAGALERDRFTWASARAELDGLPAGGLNIAHEAVDRHVEAGRGSDEAMRFIAEDGQSVLLTYADLSRQSSRFAHALRSRGIGPGAVVALLGGRVPEIYVAMLGGFKARSVVAPLFSAFGPEPLRQRLAAGRAVALVTTPSFYRQKIQPVREALPDLAHIFVFGEGAAGLSSDGLDDLDALLATMPAEYDIESTDPDEPALVHFTSGTTGVPKGAVHVHGAVVAHRATGREILDLRPGDRYWCTADPGWVTGTCYGLIAPLACGATCVVDTGEFDATRWYRILEHEQVSVWYTAPTALRMLMKAGPLAHAGRDLSSIRLAASVGEPLNAEVVHWGRRELGLDIHDTWWQTETGAIMIANDPALEIRAGSMGRPVPGIDIALVAHGDDGERVLGSDGSPVFVRTPGVDGEIAIRAPWPSMMHGYLNAPDRFAKCFAGEWYLSGDMARFDEAGYYWFVGRSDDVIKSAGHLIGPFEVESVLMEHPAVAAAGVIGVPDPIVGEAVRAYVELKAGFVPSDALRRDIVALARRRLGSSVAPRVVEFIEHLPVTQSGKIMRRLLRAQALQLPTGDISTLGVTP